MSTLQISLEQQIASLEAEVAVQQSDVSTLQEALTALEAGKPRPANPSADNAFELLKELLTAAPQSLEQQQVHQAKLAEAQRALELAIASVGEKQQRLDALRQQQREQQQAEAFEELKAKAAAFNSLIYSAMVELDEMRALAKVAGPGTLEIATDPNETPFCQVTANSVKLRRHFDIKRSN